MNHTKAVLVLCSLLLSSTGFSNTTESTLLSQNCVGQVKTQLDEDINDLIEDEELFGQLTEEKREVAQAIHTQFEMTKSNEEHQRLCRLAKLIVLFKSL